MKNVTQVKMPTPANSNVGPAKKAGPRAKLAVVPAAAPPVAKRAMRAAPAVVAASTMVDQPTAAQITEAWSADPVRAARIVQIMKEDGISYERAVKRSLRRMKNEGYWS